MLEVIKIHMIKRVGKINYRSKGVKLKSEAMTTMCLWLTTLTPTK